MTTSISIEIILGLLRKTAEYCGPAAVQYVKIFTGGDGLSTSELEELAVFFGSFEDPDLVEETCYQAMEIEGARPVNLAVLMEALEEGIIPCSESLEEDE